MVVPMVCGERSATISMMALLTCWMMSFSSLSESQAGNGAINRIGHWFPNSMFANFVMEAISGVKSDSAPPGTLTLYSTCQRMSTACSCNAGFPLPRLPPRVGGGQINSPAFDTVDLGPA